MYIGRHKLAAAIRAASDLLPECNRGSSEAGGSAPPQRSALYLLDHTTYLHPHQTLFTAAVNACLHRAACTTSMIDGRSMSVALAHIQTSTTEILLPSIIDMV